MQRSLELVYATNLNNAGGQLPALVSMAGLPCIAVSTGAAFAPLPLLLAEAMCSRFDTLGFFLQGCRIGQTLKLKLYSIRSIWRVES